MSHALETDRYPQETPEEIAYIRAALIQGEQSGDPQPFDFDEFKKEMAAIYAEVSKKKSQKS